MSSCGARQEVAGFLLAINSPLLASLLGQAETGVPLPLSLPEVRGLVQLLQGEHSQQGRQKEDLLCIAYDGLNNALGQLDSTDINPVMAKQQVMSECEEEVEEQEWNSSKSMAMLEEEELLWRAGLLNPDSEEN